MKRRDAKVVRKVEEKAKPREVGPRDVKPKEVIPEKKEVKKPAPPVKVAEKKPAKLGDKRKTSSSAAKSKGKKSRK